MEEIILFQPSVIKRICKNLTVEEVVQFLAAYNRTTIDCPIPFKDKIEKRKLVLPGINPLTFEVYKLVKTKGLNSALLETAAQGKNKLIPILLKMGADINVKSKISGETPLIWATLAGHTPTINLLLANGAEIDAINYQGETALLIAVQKNYVKIVNTLLNHRANPNILSAKNRTPLITAVNNNRSKLVLILLNRGADVNIQNTSGNTALLYAVQNGYNIIVKILLKHGADINVMNNNGDTPRSVAEITGNRAALSLLVN